MTQELPSLLTNAHDYCCPTREAVQLFGHPPDSRVSGAGLAVSLISIGSRESLSSPAASFNTGESLISEAFVCKAQAFVANRVELRFAVVVAVVSVAAAVAVATLAADAVVLVVVVVLFVPFLADVDFVQLHNCARECRPVPAFSERIIHCRQIA